MRARDRRNRRNRKITLAAVLVSVVALLAIVAYTASLPSQGAGLDSKDNQPVTASDLEGLQTASLQPYGPGPTTGMMAAMRTVGGTPWMSGGKPVVVYVGGEYCMYCAMQRWALIIALSRFGEFTSLGYMTSASNEGDLPTFTFVGSTYTSSYVMFRPFEVEDRSDPPRPLQSLPSNYSAVWSQAGGGYPFIDFGDSYIVAGSLLSDTSLLQGKNWTTVINGMSASAGGGSQIKEAANLITAIICKVTGYSPSSVCGAAPITSVMGGVSTPGQGPVALQSPRKSGWAAVDIGLMGGAR